MTSHTEHTLKQLCQVLKAVSVPCGTLTERLHSPTETNWTSATRVSAEEKEEPCWVLATWGYPEWPCLHLSVYSILLGTNWFLTLCGRMNIFTVKKGWSNCFFTDLCYKCFFLHLLHLFISWVLLYSPNIWTLSWVRVFKSFSSSSLLSWEFLLIFIANTLLYSLQLLSQV